MTTTDLASARHIDFASVRLTYEGFRALARNPHLSMHGRIGFPDSYRVDHERAIFEDIKAKVPTLAQHGRTVLDIGPGCANLPGMIIELCAQQSHTLWMIDSPEMLQRLPDAPHVRKLEGAFPDRLAATDSIARGGVDALLCYSVFHYLFAEINPFHAVDTIVAALAPGGVALIGDIPNASKRKRFFASAAGREYHFAFTGSDSPPDTAQYDDLTGKIDDSVLMGLMRRAQQAGCDAYLVPQPDILPMANRRDDLVIRKP
jgi:hypothetical protein